MNEKIFKSRTLRRGCAYDVCNLAVQGQKSAKDASQAESTAEGETPAETEEYVAEGSITLGDYKGIPVTVTEPTVTDEEVDAQIQQLLNSSAEYLEVDQRGSAGRSG